jgi:hypothetical protein
VAYSLGMALEEAFLDAVLQLFVREIDVKFDRGNWVDSTLACGPGRSNRAMNVVESSTQMLFDVFVQLCKENGVQRLGKVVVPVRRCTIRI